MAEPPNHTYFRPKHGRWAGHYEFRNDDVRALLLGSMGLFDKITFLALSLFCRVLGALRIETMVDASGIERGTVYHTTFISKWGLPLQRSEEWFALAPDGRTFTVTGTVRIAPSWWSPHPYRESRGEVDEAGRCAAYQFSWRGATLHQRSEPEEGALRFLQEADGCRATFVLRSAGVRGGV